MTLDCRPFGIFFEGDRNWTTRSSMAFSLPPASSIGLIPLLDIVMSSLRGNHNRANQVDEGNITRSHIGPPALFLIA